MNAVVWVAVALLAACSDYELHREEADVAAGGGPSSPWPTLEEKFGGDTVGVGEGQASYLDTAGRLEKGDGEDESACERAARITGYLDQFQTEGDGRVLFCHSGSGNGYNFVDSDIDSCSAHIDHGYDVFPSTGCDS